MARRTKTISLTQNKVAVVDAELYDWLNKWKWYAKKGRYTYYAVRSVRLDSGSQRQVYMHREILGVTDSLQHCDHKDGDGLRNIKDNLRVVTNLQNQLNKRPVEGKSSKYKGVSWNIGVEKWIAHIRVDKKLKHLGCFEDENEAALIYDSAAKEHFGEYAYLNFGD